MRLLPLLLLWPSLTWAAPTVPKVDLERVPEAWRATWEPFQQEVTDKARAAATAEQMQQKAEGEVALAEKGLEDAEDAAKDAKKAAKKARKDKDPAAARAAADARARTAEARVQAEQAVAHARAEAQLATATAELAEARHALAVARLEQVKAQAVADAGGWVDKARFDEEVLRAAAGVEAAEAELQRARSAAVLTRQDG